MNMKQIIIYTRSMRISAHSPEFDVRYRGTVTVWERCLAAAEIVQEVSVVYLLTAARKGRLLSEVVCTTLKYTEVCDLLNLFLKIPSCLKKRSCVFLSGTNHCKE